MKKLTSKQEAFCNAYMKYKNQSQAYLEAYPRSKNYKNNSLRQVAQKLFNTPHVKAHIELLKEKAEKKLIITFKQKEQWLKEIIEQAMAAGDTRTANNAIKAIAEHNKMQGDLAPTKTDNKTEVKGDLDFNVKFV